MLKNRKPSVIIILANEKVLFFCVPYPLLVTLQRLLKNSQELLFSLPSINKIFWTALFENSDTEIDTQEKRQHCFPWKKIFQVIKLLHQKVTGKMSKGGVNYEQG